MQYMIVDGQEVCPRCQTEKWNKELERETSIEMIRIKKQETQRIFETKSLLQDKTLLNASFETYQTSASEERVNKQQALRYAEEYKQGQQFNLWFYGKPGVGKSHLAMSMLKELNSLDTSCLFIDIDEMLRKIRASFKTDNGYSEDYFIDLLTKVDFLVLDDLGAETGNIDSDKIASDYTSKVLRAVVNGRQDKSTIITTNLASDKLLKMYDPKLISRMMKNVKVIKFEHTKDKRIHNIGF